MPKHAAQHRAQEPLYAQCANAQLKDDDSGGSDGAQDSRSPGLQPKGAEKKTGRGQNKDEQYSDNDEIHAVSMPRCQEAARHDRKKCKMETHGVYRRRRSSSKKKSRSR